MTTINTNEQSQPTTEEYQTVQEAWNALQSVPSYVERRQTNLICEDCGKEFEASAGYFEQDDPSQGVIGYAYCSGCCHW